MGSLALAMFSSGAFGDPPRQRILMDAGWRFHRGEIPGVAVEGPKGGVRKWRWTAAEAGAARMADPRLDTTGAGWADVETGVDVFKGRVGFAWFRAVLPNQETTNRVLRFENVDDNATVYLNGKKMGAHSGWGEEFDVDLTPGWQPKGPNVLAVLVENTAGMGGIIGPVYFPGQLENDPSYLPPRQRGPLRRPFLDHRSSSPRLRDLVGVNYSPDKYDAIHKAHPAKPLFASETASTLTTRGEYADDKRRTLVSSYNMTDSSWAPVAERAFVAGSFVWTGFDYKGEPTPYKWPCISSHFGIMDSCGFPKDNYYYYQSWWKTDPVVHIMPHWNWRGREGQEIKVIVFSNCEKVELFLDGQSLGTRTMRRNGHLEWNLKYAAGALEAKGSNQGQLAAADKVETTGAPAALRLKTDRVVLAADSEDLSVIEVDVIDAEGRVVPTAGNRVSFSVEGPGRVAGVGNGDPGDHDPDKALSRRAFNGKCMVLVGAIDEPGSIALRATADGLKPATLKLQAD